MIQADIPLIRPENLDALFASRASDAHKGRFGTLGIIGGGPGMTGAALLAARAALRLGAGKVLLGFTETPAPLPCDPMQPEVMCRDARCLISDPLGVNTWVAGCGAGQAPFAIDTMTTLLRDHRETPFVLDADALNLIAAGALSIPSGKASVRVLTPHPAEAGRLLGSNATAVQADRPAAARLLASKYGAWVVLKGAGSIVCAPDGSLQMNTSGNPALATAGTGDVLAGMLGSLLAQGFPPEVAVPGAVWIHGAAADACVAAGLGPIGLTAGELAEQARAIRNRQNRSKTTL